MADDTVTPTPPAANGQVMDVVAPPTPVAAIAITPTGEITEAAPVPPPAEGEVQDPSSPAEEPSVTPPAADQPPVTAEATPEVAKTEPTVTETEATPEAAKTDAPTAVAAEDTAKPADQKNPDEKPPLGVPLGDRTAHHHRRPLGVVIVAIIIALLLAGLSVYAWQKTKPATKAKTSSSTTASTVAAIKPADVNQASQDVDATLKQVDDTKDLNANDLSNATLGL